MRTRNLLGVGVLAVVVLTAISVVAVAAIHGRTDNAAAPFGISRTTTCAVPNLAGAVVNVSLSNSGGPMMGGPMAGRGVRGGMMRVTVDAASVPRGTVSFVATNLGSINHELVILPLPTGQIVGTRPLPRRQHHRRVHEYRRGIQHVRCRHRRRHRPRFLELDNPHARTRSLRARVQHPGPLRGRHVHTTHRPLARRLAIPVHASPQRRSARSSGTLGFGCCRIDLTGRAEP